MKIGIIGHGVVGGAVAYGMKRLGHDVAVHDIKMGTKIDVVLGSDLVFVCVPTPMADDGSCDTLLVEGVVDSLSLIGYMGLIVIKSTVPPGFTDRLRRSYLWLRLAFCPEFLREKSSYSDFVENHDVCIIGTYSDDDYELIKQAHHPFPKAYVNVTPTEAEVCKYFSNAFNAMKIIFANQFFEVCEGVGADYQNVKAAMSLRSVIGASYLECNKNFRAFGGACLPKDLSALAHLVREKKIDAGLFEWLLRENHKIGKRS